MPVTKILDIGTTLPSVKRRRGRVGQCAGIAMHETDIWQEQHPNVMVVLADEPAGELIGATRRVGLDRQSVVSNSR
jgi:hypothetical protein